MVFEDGASFALSSNVISVKTGAFNVDGVSTNPGVSSNEMSKSVGIGKSFAITGTGSRIDSFIAVVSLGWVFSSVFSDVDLVYVLNSSILFFAAANAARISSGKLRATCSGIGSCSFFSCLVSGSLVASGFFCQICGIFIFGIWIVINGFFVRNIKILVATYNGTHARIKIPNTNPGNPRSCA